MKKGCQKLPGSGIAPGPNSCGRGGGGRRGSCAWHGTVTAHPTPKRPAAAVVHGSLLPVIAMQGSECNAATPLALHTGVLRPIPHQANIGLYHTTRPSTGV